MEAVPLRILADAVGIDREVMRVRIKDPAVPIRMEATENRADARRHRRYPLSDQARIGIYAMLTKDLHLGHDTAAAIVNGVFGPLRKFCDEQTEMWRGLGRGAKVDDRFLVVDLIHGKYNFLGFGRNEGEKLLGFDEVTTMILRQARPVIVIDVCLVLDRTLNAVHQVTCKLTEKAVEASEDGIEGAE